MKLLERIDMMISGPTKSQINKEADLQYKQKGKSGEDEPMGKCPECGKQFKRGMAKAGGKCPECANANEAARAMNVAGLPKNIKDKIFIELEQERDRQRDARGKISPNKNEGEPVEESKTRRRLGAKK